MKRRNLNTRAKEEPEDFLDSGMAASKRGRKIPKEVEDLFHRLRLQNKFEQKLTADQFLNLGHPVKLDCNVAEKDLVQLYVQRLMTLDYRARYIVAQQGRSDIVEPCSVKVSESTCTEDDLDALFSSSKKSNLTKGASVHPMDVQMAVFHCSNFSLKQKMIIKLSQCQYALPFLLPDLETADIVCPLWTFRQITKNWKKTELKDKSKTVTTKSSPICNAETPLVSFLRLGSLTKSKSELMNSLINERHNTFFHRNCPGSSKSRHLMDGVAEIVWYCPAGKPTDKFTDCVAFCNLHGDSMVAEKQRDILTEISSVVVVLVPTLEKAKETKQAISALFLRPKPLIVLVDDSDCDPVQVKPLKFKLGLEGKSQSDVSVELKEILGQILGGEHTRFKLESVSHISSVKTDEDQQVCRDGKSAAMKIVSFAQGMDVSKIKAAFLPCQGQLWKKWCELSKGLYKLKENVEIEKDRIQREQMELRRKQCAASSGEMMKTFTHSLMHLGREDKVYFLKWTQILTDGLSVDDLSSLLHEYDKKWSEVLSLKKKQKSDELKVKQPALEELSRKIQAANFGLEHIFREMAQIYEAHQSIGRQNTCTHTGWEKYPELAADLMISGHPMELLDGDAGHVPLTWISGLLKEVIGKVGDKRVFVLSVLGVQSSGKSTMLNAMFGLEFAVSAGRCTKGAYMQLVRLSEEIRKDFKFDYVLVVDTEGLRALELVGNTTLRHDNELATFVVGLANVTLINIFGENPSDMQDILQIVVQAFMRMRKVKLSPSCLFVHQNVTDIAAVEKNMDGKRRLQEKLDKVAQLAAKEEDSEAESFGDVIAFDVQKDVKYFAQLWEGSPPMAPPNTAYSESVQELKSIILSKASKSSGTKLSEFSSKIGDLWNALMNENFVFSFKNTEEIAAYRRLEVQYANWTWKLRKQMLNVENRFFPQVKNGTLHNIELSDLHREMNETYEGVKKEKAAYFKEDADKELLAQWVGRFDQKIKEFHEKLIKGVKRKLDDVLQQKKACKKMDEKKTEIENKLLEQSKDLAHKLKGITCDDAELSAQFDLVWESWIKELTSDTKPIPDISIEKDEFEVLREIGIEWQMFRESKLSQKYKKLPEISSYYDYVILRKNQMAGALLNKVEENTHWKVSPLCREDQEKIRSFVKNVEQQSMETLKEKPVAITGYSVAYLQDMSNNIKKRVSEFESKMTFTFKKEFTTDLLLYVFDRAAPWLRESHQTYKSNNDAEIYVKSKKGEYYNIFQSFYKGSSSAMVFGGIICDRLKNAVAEYVLNETVSDLVEKIKTAVPAFKGNRENLEKGIMTYLAEKENFDKFITYTQNPRRMMESFIGEKVRENMNQREWPLEELENNIERVNRLISKALDEATSKVRKETGNIDIWMKEFSSSLSERLPFSSLSCQNFRDISSFDFLSEEIEKSFKAIDQRSNFSLYRCTRKMEEFFIQHLCTCCWEQCMFCGAVCTNTIPGHDPSYEKHSVRFHRSSAIMGWHIRGTNILVPEFCTTLVSSERRFYPTSSSSTPYPYKQFQNAGGRYATWSIPPDNSMLPYWKWFICRFKSQLENYHGLKFTGKGNIPSGWYSCTRQQAIDSLNQL